MADYFGMDPAVTEHLNRAYGDQAKSVLEMANEGFNDILVEGYSYLEAEVLWAVRREMACRAMDFLARRTPLALINTAAADTAARRTIQIMASELGWDSERRRLEEQEVQERLSFAI